MLTFPARFRRHDKGTRGFGRKKGGNFKLFFFRKGREAIYRTPNPNWQGRKKNIIKWKDDEENDKHFNRRFFSPAVRQQQSETCITDIIIWYYTASACAIDLIKEERLKICRFNFLQGSAVMTDGKINQKHTDSAISTAYISNNSYRKSSIIIGKKLIINMKEITGQSDSSRESRGSQYIGCQRDICSLCFHRRRRIYETAVKRKWSAADIRDARRRYHTRSTSFRFFDDISFFASCLHTHTNTDTRAPLYRSVGYPTTKSYQEKDLKNEKFRDRKFNIVALCLIFQRSAVDFNNNLTYNIHFVRILCCCCCCKLFFQVTVEFFIISRLHRRKAQTYLILLRGAIIGLFFRMTHLSDL